MTWRIDADGGRFVAADDTGSITADPETRLLAETAAGRPVMVSPTGPTYTPADADDPVWWFLLAVGHLPGPVRISGTRPPLPSIPHHDDGPVF